MLTICVTLVVAAGLAVVWVRVVQTLKAPASGPKTVGQPGALVWDGRVFTTSGQMKRYLKAHGLSYSRWAAQHPTAFGASPPPVKHATTKKTAAKPTAHHVAAPAVSDTKPRSLTSLALTTLLLIIGLGLAASTMLPERLAPERLQRFYAEPDRRVFVFAAATAILLGFAVSFYLT